MKFRNAERSARAREGMCPLERRVVRRLASVVRPKCSLNLSVKCNVGFIQRWPHTVGHLPSLTTGSFLAPHLAVGARGARSASVRVAQAR